MNILRVLSSCARVGGSGKTKTASISAHQSSVLHSASKQQRTMPELLGAMYANMHVHTSPRKRLVIHFFRRDPATALPMPMHMYMYVVMMVMVPIGTVGSGGHGGRCVVRAPAMQRGRMGGMMLPQFSVPIAVADLARIAAGHVGRAAKPG